jgi:hypothetical protein
MADAAGYTGMVASEYAAGYTGAEGYTGVVYGKGASGYTGSVPVTTRGSPRAAEAAGPQSSYDSVVEPAAILSEVAPTIGRPDGSADVGSATMPDLFGAVPPSGYDNVIVLSPEESTRVPSPTDQKAGGEVRQIVESSERAKPSGYSTVLNYAGLILPSQEELSRILGYGPEPYSDAGPFGYEYLRDETIGTADARDDINLMTELQRSPNRHFPFNVIPADGGSDAIRRNGIYDLEDRYIELPPILPPGLNPVKVTEVTPTSFTFTTLPGHFDPPGSTITFKTYVDESGSVHLQHRGITAPTGSSSPTYLLGPSGGNRAWSRQSASLRKWLENQPQPETPPR